MPQINMQEGSVFEEGYGIVAKKVMLDEDISTTAKAIYSLLCTYGDATSEEHAYPSVDFMADKLDITRKTLYKHLNQLLEKDYIRKHKNKQEGKFANNTYEIIVMPSPCSKSSYMDSSYMENDHTISTSSISTTNNNTSKTYITPAEHTDGGAISHYLNLFELYFNEQHQPISKEVFNEARELLERLYDHLGEEEFVHSLNCYFEQYSDNTDIIPRLDFFLKSAGNYFIDIAHSVIRDFYMEKDWQTDSKVGGKHGTK